jgi:hypothetical protein
MLFWLVLCERVQRDPETLASTPEQHSGELVAYRWLAFWGIAVDTSCRPAPKRLHHGAGQSGFLAARGSLETDQQAAEPRVGVEAMGADDDV